MTHQNETTPGDFFWNASAQDAGFSGQFWLNAYNLYLDAVERSPDRSLDRFFDAYTVRVPFGQGHVEVLVY